MCHVHSEEADKNENIEYYNETIGRVISRMVCHHNDKHECVSENKIQLAQTHSLKKGIIVLGDKGKNAVYQEMNQTHE